MNSQFCYSFRDVEHCTYVTLSGNLNESCTFPDLTDCPPPVVLNTAGIDNVNSVGVRAWMIWVHQIKQPLLFVECSPMFVVQANMIEDFLGRGLIFSFQIPYFCEACGSNRLLLIETRSALGLKSFKPPICNCIDCKKTMDLEVIEAFYFNFLKKMKKTSLIIDRQLDSALKPWTTQDSPSTNLRRSNEVND